MRLFNDHSLLNAAIAVATTAVPTAAFGVFCGLQVAEFDHFLPFFLRHFMVFLVDLAFRELSS